MYMMCSAFVDKLEEQLGGEGTGWKLRRRIQFHGRRQTSSEKFPLVSRSGNLKM